jgi:hypothetical protein
MWQFRRHSSKCRKPNTNRVLVKQDGEYTCSICNKSMKTRNIFNRHIFEMHTDIDVRVKYNKTVETLIGKKEMERLRAPTVTKITNGNWESYLGEISKPDDPGWMHQTEYERSWDNDSD